MNDRQRRIYETAVRVLSFVNSYLNVLRVYPIVIEMTDELTNATETLAALGAKKVTKSGEAKDSTIHRGDARDHLLDLMRDITDMWKRIAPKTGGDINKFQTPRGNDQNILASAGSFADQAEEVKDEFTTRTFEPDFIDKLRAATDAFAATVNESDTARRERVGTNAAFDAPVKTCKTLIEDFDPIIKMHFRDNPQARAEWLVASHVQRAPRPVSAPKAPAN